VQDHASPSLTFLEHEVIPITADGRGRSITEQEAERLAAVNEARPGFCERGFRQVRLAQYCGLVNLGMRALEVLPKVQSTETGPEHCRGILMRLLSKSQLYPHVMDLPAAQRLRQQPLLEVFISAYFDSVTAVLRCGLLKQYQEVSEDLHHIRGRINVNRQLTALANRTDMGACVYDELTTDHLWNRLLKLALKAARTWIRSADLGRKWIELMGSFENVTDIQTSALQLDRLMPNRHTRRYVNAARWATWILKLLSPNMRHGNREAPTLLFDMNVLFEAAVANSLRGRATQAGLTLHTQDRSHHLATVLGPSEAGAILALRPDLVFRQHGQAIAIADTKWKPLRLSPKGLPQPGDKDVYQVFAYAAAYGCTDLALIYPWSHAAPQVKVPVFELPKLASLGPRLHLLGISVDEDHLPVVIGEIPPSLLALL
jgi:5-methylcytosine-specific restriction enzyme subunit McrC